MGKHLKLLATIFSGETDAAIRFGDLCRLLRRLGFVEKIRGSHHLFRQTELRERLNLQRRGSQAKPYQVKQVRRVTMSLKPGGRP